MTLCCCAQVKDILWHDWMKDMDFNALLEGKVEAPWVPPSSGEGDTSNFDDYDVRTTLDSDLDLT